MDEGTESESRGRPGRPAHQPTDASRRQVKLCSAFGNTHLQIGKIMGISAPTLRLHYADELEIGRLEAANAVKENLFRLAIRPEFKAVRAIEIYFRFVEKMVDGAREQSVFGKKELASQEAMHAHEDETGWGEILAPLGKPN